MPLGGYETMSLHHFHNFLLSLLSAHHTQTQIQIREE